MFGPEDTDEDDDLRVNTDLTFEELVERVMGADPEDDARE